MFTEKQKTVLKEYGMITLAVLIMDLGIYLFKFPNNFSFGGVSGMAVVLKQVIPVSPASINLVINLILLVAGFLFLGRDFGLKTAYITVLSSIMLSVFEKVYPLSAPLTDQIGLELIYAIVLPALGAAIFFTENASGGGTDILAMILKKYTTYDIATALFFIDAVVVAASFIVFDFKTGLYSVCGLMAKTLFIDKAIERLKLSKYFTIVCDDAEPICNYINNELNRSATIYEAQGAYTHEGKKVILSALNPKQTVKLQRFIQVAEPTAFVMITKSSEIIGKGFSPYL